MKAGPWAPEERVITGYAAAVAVAVAMFFIGAALDARWHPVAQPEAMPWGATEAIFAFLTTFLLVLVAALVPVLAGLAAFRRARVTHPAWFAAYGAATGLLLANIFQDVGANFMVPAFAGAAGGLTFRAIMGRPAMSTNAAETRHAGPMSLDDPRTAAGRLVDHDAHATYLSDAFASDDPALVVLALKEIGTLRRMPVALDENPPLGEVLRVVRELGFDLIAKRQYA